MDFYNKMRAFYVYNKMTEKAKFLYNLYPFNCLLSQQVVIVFSLADVLRLARCAVSSLLEMLVGFFLKFQYETSKRWKESRGFKHPDIQHCILCFPNSLFKVSSQDKPMICSPSNLFFHHFLKLSYVQ